MTRRSNTEERREQIARALLRVMAKKGYEGATISDVAREADLLPGLVHYHFENKLDILLDVMERLITAHLRGLDAALEDAGDDPRARLDAFIDHHLALDRANPDALAAWVTISAEALRQKRVGRAFAKAIGEIARRLEVIISGKKRKEHTAAVLAAIQGYYVLASATPDIIPRGSAAISVRRMAHALMER